MNKAEIKTAVKKALKRGNWIIRADRDGISHGGFRWQPVGEWTEAPDWRSDGECGGGLHGQDRDHGGHIPLGVTRLVFCETDGEHIPVGCDKVKVRRARILLVDELPSGLVVNGNLNLSDCTGLRSLPAGLEVRGSLDLYDCTGLRSLPDDLTVGGSLGLARCTGLTALPDGLKVGGGLDLTECTGLRSLPKDLTVGGNLYLFPCSGIKSLPKGIKVKGKIYR